MTTFAAYSEVLYVPPPRFKARQVQF